MKHNKQFYREKKFRKLHKQHCDGFWGGYTYLPYETQVLGTAVDKDMCPCYLWKDADILAEFIYISINTWSNNDTEKLTQNEKFITGKNFEELEKYNFVDIKRNIHAYTSLKELYPDIYEKYVHVVEKHDKRRVYATKWVTKIDEETGKSYEKEVGFHYEEPYSYYTEEISFPTSWFKYDVVTKHKKKWAGRIQNKENVTWNHLIHFYSDLIYKDQNTYIKNDWDDYGLFLEKKYEIKHNHNYIKEHYDEEVEYEKQEFYYWNMNEKWNKREADQSYDYWLEYQQKQAG